MSLRRQKRAGESVRAASVHSVVKTALSRVLRRPWKAALCLGGVAFVVRAGFVLNLQERWYFYDTVHYDAAARSLLSGEGFRYERPFFGTTAYNLEPLYPLFLAANYATFGRRFLAVRVVQGLLGALTCVVVFSLARRLFDVKVAALAGAICALYPHLVFISGLLYPEQLFTLLLAAGMWCLVRYMATGRTLLMVGVGVCMGLAALVKGIALAFVPVLVVWLLFRRRTGKGQRLAHAALFVGTVVVVLLPWSLRNYRVFGQLAPVRAHATMVFDQRYVQQDEPLVAQWMHGKVDTWSFLVRYVEEFVRFWTPTLGRLQSRNEFTTRWANMVSIAAAGPVLLFALLGVWFARKRLNELMPLLLLVMTFACTYAFFLTHVRYRIPVEPYLILLAAFGWCQAGIALGLCRADSAGGPEEDKERG